MNEKSNEKLKATLARKLELARDNRHNKQYLMAVMGFNTYIGSTPELEPIISKLIEEEKIAPIYLQELFNDFVMSQFLARDAKIGLKLQFPNFYNLQLEQKFKLLPKLLNLIEVDYEDFKTHPDQLIFDPNARVVHLKNDEDFYYLQKLFNDIIEALDNEKTKQAEADKNLKFNEAVEIARSYWKKLNDEELTKRLPYWEEDYLFLVYKILKGNQRQTKSAFSIGDIQPQRWPWHFIYYCLGNLCKELGIQLEGLVFHKEIYKKYCPQEFQEIQKLIDEKLDDKRAFGYKKIFENDFKIEDFGQIEFLFNFKYNGIYEFIEFDTKLSEKTQEKLEGYLRDYLQFFINNQLTAERKNYLTFERMKAEVISSLRLNSGRYGSSFLFKFRNVFLAISHYDEFLFLHTLFALELLEYLTIEDIWVFDMDLPPEKQTDEYKIKLYLLPKFFDEQKAAMTIPSTAAVKNKKPESGKSPLSFDPKNSILHFMGKEILVAKSKDTDAHYLLETLFKEPKKVWNFDEISADWGNAAYDKDDWNKFYNAAYSINGKVAKATTISDFLEKSKSTVNITKKYL